MPKVILLCGRIAAGKSHYAEQLKEKGAVVLSCDHVMLTLFDGCLGEKHDEIVLATQRYFCSIAPQIFRLGADVVLDYGHWSRALRDEMRALCTGAGLPVELHYLTTDEETRKARLKRRNAENATKPGRQYIIDEALLERLDGKFEPPEAWEIDRWIRT